MQASAQSDLRVLLAPMYEGDWLNGIVADVRESVRNLGGELFLMGDKKYIDAPEYISLEELAKTFNFEKLSKSSVYRSHDLTHIKELECLNILANTPHAMIDKKRIDATIDYWFASIVFALKLVRPAFGIVWNGSIHKAAVYVEAFKFLNIPYAFAEKGFLPGSWCLDSKGINANSSIVGKDFSRDVNVSIWEKKIADIDEKGESAWEQPERLTRDALARKLNLPQGKKIIFFPGQVDSDTNVILFLPHFKNTAAVLQWLASLPADRYYVLAKPHPKGLLKKEEYERILGDRGSVQCDLHVLDAINIADCIVTINSTVAFEAAIRRKPVLMLGQGILSGKSFVQDYIPGKTTADQIDATVRGYERHKSSIYRDSLAFMSFLDSTYYTYKGNAARTQQIISSLLKPLPQTAKSFDVAEISLFLDKHIVERLDKHLNKWLLLELLKRKAKRFVGSRLRRITMRDLKVLVSGCAV